MIQSRARSALKDLREDIMRRGYDEAEKRWLNTLFGDLKYLYSDTSHATKLSSEAMGQRASKLEQVTELQQRWQKDRRNTAGGADTIAAILAEVEKFIPDLPVEVKSNVIVIPSQDEVQADRILAVLKRRGATISV